MADRYFTNSVSIAWRATAAFEGRAPSLATRSSCRKENEPAERDLGEAPTQQGRPYEVMAASQEDPVGAGKIEEKIWERL